MNVSAVVISHRHADELEQSLPVLAAQVDELLVIANIAGSLPAVLPEGTRVLENLTPLSFAANANLGAANTAHELVLIANPDAVPETGAVATLRAFMESRPRAGVAGPRMLYSDGTWQASRRGFPTIGATLVRRTPLRLLFPPLRWQRRHYLLDDRPEEPVEADTMLGAFLLLRREMLDEIGGWDPGYRMYCEDIDLNYRAAKAGWERWYVPAAVVRHEYAAVVDKRFLTRHTLWHARAMLRFLRKHPERLLALR
jgi:N-acetylglucosaminyl-diphospho-decaprenol L-rhamnosyltransferase